LSRFERGLNTFKAPDKSFLQAMALRQAERKKTLKIACNSLQSKTHACADVSLPKMRSLFSDRYEVLMVLLKD